MGRVPALTIKLHLELDKYKYRVFDIDVVDGSTYFPATFVPWHRGMKIPTSLS